MLRLPPTRITLDVRDIEYHDLHGEERLQRLMASGLTNRIAFGQPLLQRSKGKTNSSPQKEDKSPNKQNDQKEQLRIDELLRDSVSFTTRDILKGNLLNDTANVFPNQEKVMDTTADKQGSTLLSFDGHVEPIADLISFDNSPNNLDGGVIPCNSPMTPTTAKNVLKKNVDILTNSLEELVVEDKGSGPISTGPVTPKRGTQDHDSLLLGSEPSLPSPCPRVSGSAPRNDNQIETVHDNNSSGYRLHASPVVSTHRHSSRASVLDNSSQSSNYRNHAFAHSPIGSHIFSSVDTNAGINHIYTSEGFDMHLGHVRSPGHVGWMSNQSRMVLDPTLQSPRTPQSRRSYNAAGDESTSFETRSSPSNWSRMSARLNVLGRQSNELLVYEDNLPPEMQPQTPIGLPSHGIPHSLGPYPMTAPHSRGPSRLPQPTTPTRTTRWRPRATPQSVSVAHNSQYSSEYDQENAAVFAEWERRRQARAERLIALRQGGEVLDATPPPGFGGNPM